MGPAKSFLDLVYNAPLKYDYYAFCDQDDYWKEDKLYKAIERLEHFDDKPALYHCELEIVDENLEHIKMTRNCNKTKFIDQTLMVFYIPGCTMVFNNCLMRKIQERKPEFDLITMHDCWLYYICLGIGGKIISDKNAYIQYRQHGNNVIGAKRISIRKKIQMICQQNGSPRAKMIDEIIRLYGQDMKKEMLSKYKTFASYPKSIYNIIDSRYRSQKPLIVTTNLTLTELKNPQNTAHARIYDRLLELCTPIACTGPSMRKDIGQAKLNLLKALLA